MVKIGAVNAFTNKYELRFKLLDWEAYLHQILCMIQKQCRLLLSLQNNDEFIRNCEILWSMNFSKAIKRRGVHSK